VSPALDAHEEVMMNTGLHALTWGLQRLGIALAVVVFVPLVALTILVAVIVVGQAAATFGT
jgi:hypothetical protein